jgi:hypothetical protein
VNEYVFLTNWAGHFDLAFTLRADVLAIVGTSGTRSLFVALTPHTFDKPPATGIENRVGMA